MGQKVNPKNFRIPNLYSWSSKWFGKKSYSDLLREDIKIRDYIQSKLKDALIEKIEIERSSNAVTIIVHATKPGLIIGRGGTGIESLKKEIQRGIIKQKQKVDVNIIEVKKPLQSANVVARTMVVEIEKRMAFRRVLKQTISKVMKEGAKGVKVMVSGRLNGSEIARTEHLSAGKLPLHTLRADIDFAKDRAYMTYGVIGIKVWIYRGEVFDKAESK
ncbi:MAG: 30S ribosomal protein S3 [Parcubacteria group bacterium]|nr:30S ribosomal protein S3 [Parcubacteria group bacterium]